MSLTQTITQALESAPEGWDRRLEFSRFEAMDALRLRMFDWHNDYPSLHHARVIYRGELITAIDPDMVVGHAVEYMARELDEVHMSNRTGQEVQQ